MGTCTRQHYTHITLHTQVCVYGGHANMCVCALYSQTPVSVIYIYLYGSVCVYSDAHPFVCGL